MRTLRMLVGALAAAGAIASTEGTARADLFKGGVGVIGAFGGNFLDKPDNKTITVNGVQGEANPSYPGFGGVTGGFGLALDARFLGVVGLEVDIIRMSNQGHADIDLSGKSYTVKMGHDAWHIPVLLKGSLPLPLLSPFAVVGLEFVQTSNGTASISDGPLAYDVAARTSNYHMFTAGLGLEIKLPIPALDIRIPFSLRGSYYNPGDSVTDRATYEYGPSHHANLKVTYNTPWKWQALATLGAQIYF